MNNLITLRVCDDKKEAFFREILKFFDFVEIVDHHNEQSEVYDAKDSTVAMSQQENPQTFRDFTLDKVQEIFRLDKKTINLFPDVTSVQVSALLERALKVVQHKSLRTEKERSEFLIAPILTELEERNDFSFKVFSGEKVDIDAKRGLKGEFDFAFVANPEAEELIAPIFTLFEARQGDITKHWGQVTAQMVAALEGNKKQKQSINTVYGCVSSGESWRFAKLENDCIFLDAKTYYLPEIEQILGVFQSIIDFSGIQD